LYTGFGKENTVNDLYKEMAVRRQTPYFWFREMLCIIILGKGIRFTVLPFCHSKATRTEFKTTQHCAPGNSQLFTTFFAGKHMIEISTSKKCFLIY